MTASLALLVSASSSPRLGRLASFCLISSNFCLTSDACSLSLASGLLLAGCERVAMADFRASELSFSICCSLAVTWS